MEKYIRQDDIWEIVLSILAAMVGKSLVLKNVFVKRTELGQTKSLIARKEVRYRETYNFKYMEQFNDIKLLIHCKIEIFEFR